MVPPKVLFLWPAIESDRRFIEENIGTSMDFVYPATFDEAAFLPLISDVDAVIATRMTPTLLAAAKRLRLVQTPSAGIELLPLDHLAERNIAVCNSHSASANVAEHALGMLLALMKKLALHDRMLRNGKWFRPSGNPRDSFYVSDPLRGRKVGLLGFGHIGQAFLRFLAGFDVEPLVQVRSPRPFPEFESRFNRFAIRSLHEVLREAEVLFVSLPLTKDTAGILGPAEFRLMQSATYLVSVSRAGVISEKALHAALSEGRMRGAAVDSWHPGSEHLDRFRSFDNVLLSPHRAATSRGHSDSLVDVVANLKAFASDGDLRNLVKPRAGY